MYKLIKVLVVVGLVVVMLYLVIVESMKLGFLVK